MPASPSSMMPTALGPILLVDDEVELVQAVSSMLCTEFGEARVKATSVPQRALEWIRQEKPSVLITDVRMPLMSGLELIEKMQALWGAVPTVVITAYPSEAVSQQTSRSGSLRYLPKPFSFRSLLDAIRQLETQQPASFRGAITVATLADLLQLYAISNSTGLMVVKSGQHRGEIWFERGQVVHASSAELVGFDAFSAIVSWPEGSFSWRTKRVETQTIDMSVSELLLEAYRLHDEAEQQNSRRPSFSPAVSSESEPLPDSAPLSGASFSVGGECSSARLTLGEPPPGVLEKLETIAGFVGAALVDSDRGEVLGGGRQTGDFDIAGAAAGTSDMLRAKRQTMRDLALDDTIEDILVTLSGQYHLIRPLRSRPEVFFYLVLNRARANLALARLSLADAAASSG